MEGREGSPRRHGGQVKDGGWKAGAYLTGERWIERCYTGVRAIYSGVWLGLMDRETLHETTERQYRGGRGRTGGARTLPAGYGRRWF